MSLSTDYSKSVNKAGLAQINAKDIDLTHLNADARAVLEFWFDKDNQPYWFEKNDDFDKCIREQFGQIWQAAKQGECASWRRTESQADNNSAITNLAGRLAEIIVLDQFSRNLCRGDARSFSQDGMAVVLAQEAIKQPYFAILPMEWRRFTIMPFMHSESLAIHEQYLPLFEQLGDESTLEFEHRHKDIIEKFGRYPHRNETLGRESSADEKAFLEQPGSSF
ncbi:DUF924 domain-containing protein [Psychrobacter sp. AH5]|uniref:DUF924 family protein n=1 Tax=Psychrobacter sp. AH5 TaxID=2937433 RepID=UPI00333F81ED